MKIVRHCLALIILLSLIAFSSCTKLSIQKISETIERRRQAKPPAASNTTTPAANSSDAQSSNSTGTSNSTNSSNDQNKQSNCGNGAFEDEKPQAKKRSGDYGASTNVFGQNINASNAAGLVGNKTHSIDLPPWRIKRCDQVVQIMASRIRDYNDYSLREPAFYTLSIYMINVFNGKDNTKLIDSINIENIANVPDIIPGSKNCLAFTDVKNQKKISMCLEDQDRVDDVKEVLQKIMRCRMGDNLKELPINTIKKIFQASCLGMDVEFTSKMAGATNNFLASLNLRNKLAQTLDSQRGARVTSTNPWEIKYMTPVPGS